MNTPKANAVHKIFPNVLAPFSSITLENLAATQTAITVAKKTVAFAPRA